GVVADLRTQTIANDGFGNAETMSSVENLTAGTRFADVLYGNDGANTLSGEGGDKLYGFGGNDHFVIGDSVGFIDGGVGVDGIHLFTATRHIDLNGDGIAEVQSSYSGVYVSLTTHLIVNYGFNTYGHVYNIENVRGTGNYADVLIGDAGRNKLSGFGGND